MLHTPPTNSPLPAAKQEPNIEEISGKFQENAPYTEKKDKNRKSNRTRQKNKTGDSKEESNDSPEIPDRGATSDIPGLHSGALLQLVS